jgi:uncharacterized protein YabE (DUF348 family)
MNKFRLPIIIAVVAVVALTLLLKIPRSVELIINGESQEINTNSWTVLKVLQDGGLSIKPQDQVSPSLGQLMVGVKTISIDLARPVDITVLPANKTVSLISADRMPKDLLDQSEIAYSKKDRLQVNGEIVNPDLELPYTGAYHVQLKKAVSINIEEDGSTKTIVSSADTLAQALETNGIVLADADWISQPLDTPLDQNLDIVIRRAVPLTIQSMDDTYQIKSAALTVGEALDDSGFALQNLDYSIPDENSAIPADGIIRIVRVREEIDLTTTNIPYSSEYIKSDQVELDKTETVQAGEFGLEVTRTRVRYEDGQEVNRSEDTTWIAKEAKPQIIGRGTKVVVQTMDTPQGQIEYWRAVNVYATSYSPCRSGGDRCYPGTSSGLPVQQGVIGVTSAWYNLMVGQRIYVPGYGIGTIADIGGGIPGTYWIDLGYSDDDYVAWYSNVTIYFLTPVPDNIPWILP